MDLAFILLAEAASNREPGRFSILGGDLGVMTAPSFPTVCPILALVCKVVFSPEDGELDHEYSFRIEVRDPSGEPIVPPAQATGTPPSYNQEIADLKPSLGFVVNFPLLNFPTAGKYTFHVIVDDTDLGHVPLYLLLDSSADVQDNQADHAMDA